ncbi:MAG TPA: hypothetical protein VI160_02535 [Gemmatimonadales bacterium]
MTAGRIYGVGLALVALLGGIGTGLADPALRPALLVALGVGLLAQGPLGWWLVRSIGTGRLVQVWGVGIGARVVLVVLAGFAGPGALGVPAQPLLLALVAVILALVAVECIVLVLKR